MEITSCALAMSRQRQSTRCVFELAKFIPSVAAEGSSSSVTRSGTAAAHAVRFKPATLPDLQNGNVNFRQDHVTVWKTLLSESLS
jgi:hypothetical protein